MKSRFKIFNIFGNIDSTKKQTTFWKSQDSENLWIIGLKIIPCDRRSTVKCLKLIQILKTTLKSSCYCHVSWDTLYIFARNSNSRSHELRICERWRRTLSNLMWIRCYFKAKVLPVGKCEIGVLTPCMGFLVVRQKCFFFIGLPHVQLETLKIEPRHKVLVNCKINTTTY